MDPASLEAALREFDATEANLRKLESLWKQIRGLVGTGFAFGSPPEYDNACRAFRHILPTMPALNGFRLEDHLLDFDAIGQMRLDATEIGEIESHISAENEIEK